MIPLRIRERDCKSRLMVFVICFTLPRDKRRFEFVEGLMGIPPNSLSFSLSLAKLYFFKLGVDALRTDKLNKLRIVIFQFCYSMSEMNGHEYHYHRTTPRSQLEYMNYGVD